MAAFPFDHTVRIDVTLDDSTLRVATTVAASATGVPIAFGFHPYFALPGVARADWRVEIPVTEQLELDDQMLPTGNRTPSTSPPGRSGTARSTTPTSPRPHRSRSKAAAAGSSSRSKRATRTRRCSRRRATR